MKVLVFACYLPGPVHVTEGFIIWIIPSLCGTVHGCTQKFSVKVFLLLIYKFVKFGLKDINSISYYRYYRYYQYI